MKAKLTFGVLLSIGLFFIQSATLAQTEKLIGNWEYRAGGSVSQLKFLNENTLVFNGENSQYNLTVNAVRVYDEYGYYFDYKYVFQNDELLLTFPDGIQYPFSRAKESPAGSQSSNSSESASALFGYICSYSGSASGNSSYSSTKTIYFDGQGRFSFSTESSYSDEGAGLYGSSPNKTTGQYQISGNQITLIIDGGGTEILVINMVQTSGEITEFFHGETLYGKSLCD